MYQYSIISVDNQAFIKGLNKNTGKIVYIKLFANA